jgi:uncharacterized protein (DUF305 family)
MSLKNVALTALVGAVVVFVVWFGLGVLVHLAMPGHWSMRSGMMMGQGMMQPMTGQSGTMQPGMMQPGTPQPGMMGQGGMMGQHGPQTGMMGTALTGDPDRDFAAEMIPHHQVAVDMAKDVLAKGKDPELRKLAEGIMVTQAKEIEFLKGWLAKNPK